MNSAKNQAGSAILVSIIGIAVIAVLSLVYANIYSSVRKVQTRVDFLNTIAQIQLNITNTSNDANSWSATISDTLHNSSMGCISARTCTTATSGPFILWPAGTIHYFQSDLPNAIYDGTNPTAGYTIHGERCFHFSSAGSSDCPLHVDLSWSTAGCTPSPCKPVVTVTANILYRPAGASVVGVVNENLLELSFVQSATTLAVPCSAAPPPDQVALCSTTPYGYKLICTGTGLRCGQVYY